VAPARPRNRALLLLALVPVCHWLYLAFDDGNWGAQWAQWCFEHGAGMVISAMLAPLFWNAPGWEREAGLTACLWMAIEDAECAGCGWLSWREGPNIPSVTGLCVRHHLGVMPYQILFAGAASYLIVRGITWTRNRRT
jgi:hypothetical protein